jgi:SHNi-TPR
MTTKPLLLTAAWLGLAGLALAQAPEQRAAPAKQYEEVEILRRLLTNKLHALYPQTTWLSPSVNSSPWVDIGSPTQGFLNGIEYQLPERTRLGNWISSTNERNWTVYTGSSPGPAIEGVYLKGYGIVYTLTLPPPARPHKPEATTAAPKPLSEWDQVRRQVRGEKDKPKPPAPEAKQPSISETILRVLAENGQHLSQLGEDETVTVAITFREPRPGTLVGQNVYPTNYTNPSLYFSAGGLNPNTTPYVTEVNPGAPAVESGGPFFPPAKALKPGRSSAYDHELLGDLSLKQERNDEAVKAYQRALELVSPEQSPDTARQLKLKLARALLARGDADAAAKALEQYAALQKKQPAASASPSDAAAGHGLPDKMIITVPKRLLEQTGTGKLSFEEFRKGATVQHLTFSAREGAGTPTPGK